MIVRAVVTIGVMVVQALANMTAVELAWALVRVVADRPRLAEQFAHLSAKAVVKPIATAVPGPVKAAAQALKVTNVIDVN